MRVEAFLTASASHAPDKTALVNDRRRLSYRELEQSSDRLAAALIRCGIARGERVVIFMDNSWTTVVSIFAALKAGAVFCPINPTTKPGKLAYVLNNCEAACLITQSPLLPVASAAVSQASSVRNVFVAGTDEDLDIPGAVLLDRELDRPCDAPVAGGGLPDDLAMLIYTSGSTGFPKGVMMTHRNVVAAATSITRYLENSADDVILNVLPLSFDYGLYQAIMAVKSGATLVLERTFAFPQAILQRMKEERVTGFPIVPTMAALLLQMKDLQPGTFPHLRYITNTAAALPPAHILRLQELFPSTKLFSMYGLTECKRCTYLPPEELARRPGSVGIAIPGTEAYVVNEDGTCAGPGAVGELVIRGPHVMKGYWNDQAATDKVLRTSSRQGERVLHTGDLFRADEEGFLYFVGRKDDIIKTRGEKVSPKEVEDAIYSLPGVREVAVVGVEDRILGSAIKAVVSLAPNSVLTGQDVVRHCSRLLEDYMVPKFVEFRDELAKSQNGKIDRRAAKQALGARAE